ncbi:hypothetical protein LCGC14_2028940 [marine sediment metagenome]|uniref:DUF5659 domain-containing protein n=1 Tax=marine sediment metagenome TaxID=412755 RepID=A0A0F9EV69_9ZZZZ
MPSNNHKYLTNDTSLAAYLVSEGFEVLVIQYDEPKRGRATGTYVFNNDPQLQSVIHNYNRSNAPGDIVRYEHAKRKLLDRVMRGLP